MMDPMTTTSPGWRPDPDRPGYDRWYDSNGWQDFWQPTPPPPSTLTKVQFYAEQLAKAWLLLMLLGFFLLLLAVVV